MEQTYDLNTLETCVEQILVTDDITAGNPEKDFIVRYRGRLRSEDSEAAYDQLAAQLKPLEITPLFRWDEGRHAVLLVPARQKPKPSNPWINLVMFILTLISVLFVGILNSTADQTTPLPANPLQAGLTLIGQGLPFALALLGILGSHELGHYLMGRRHGVQVTLPYFIPMPIPPFGTLGAVINMKEIPKNRKQLLDIGLAGPFAGLIVGIPVLLLGLSLSKLDPIPLTIPQGMILQLEGNSILYLFLKFLVFGQLLPTPVSYAGMPVWLYWLRYFFTGQPAPLGALDVILHPVAFAAWGGIFVTALNLIPAGQLDGGHVLYVLFGRKNALRLIPFILVILAVLGFFWPGWWLWAFIVLLVGRVHAEPLDQITPLDNRRRALAILALVIFVLVFIPIPLSVLGAASGI